MGCGIFQLNINKVRDSAKFFVSSFARLYLRSKDTKSFQYFLFVDKWTSENKSEDPSVNSYHGPLFNITLTSGIQILLRKFVRCLHDIILKQLLFFFFFKCVKKCIISSWPLSDDGLWKQSSYLPTALFDFYFFIPHWENPGSKF